MKSGLDRLSRAFKGMLDCVELVHQMDMIHLDSKAEHFVIGKETGLVLVDFGAAFLCSENGCSPRTDLMSMGRSHYGTLTDSAPETFRYECCTGSDMWSIGVLTYAQDGTQEKYIRTASFNRTCARWQHLSANGRARSSSRYCAWNLSSECRSPTVAATTSCAGHDSVMIGNELECLSTFYFVSSCFIFVVANEINYYPTSFHMKLMCISN